MTADNPDVPDDPRFRITPVQQMAAACSGALLTSLIMTPMDVVKIRLQAQQKSINKCFLYCNGLMDHLCVCPATSQPHSISSHWYHRPGNFTGTLDALVKISRVEGLPSLWSGLGPTLVLAIPSTVVYFVTYEQLRVRLNDRVKKTTSNQPFWVPLTSGGVARIWAATLVSPLELVRTKMQSQRLSYMEMGEAVKSLIRYHGLLGLWKGLGATLLRDVPFSALYWLHYEWYKSHILRTTPNFTMTHAFIGGAFAGTVSAFVTTPFDVVKTHRQIEIGETEIYKDPPGKSRSTTFSVIRHVYKTNGFAGIFAGLTPRLVKVAPACAIMVSTFEYGKAFFQRHNQNRHEMKRVLL